MVILSKISEGEHDHKQHDIFLSFRGLDTRLNFTAHLHKALSDANIATFLDDAIIETGEFLKPELETAIKASRASIIVLSNNYASSTWCLDELVLILDQHRNTGHFVIPIFYHVEPTNVRKQQCSFRIAMEKHKQSMEKETNLVKKSRLAQRIDKWKKALTEVADLKGIDAKDWKETELIEEIVADIHHRLCVPLRVTLPLLIGMEIYIDFITSWLKDGSSLTADFLTISGIGGIGKTCLANYVFKLHCGGFQRSMFIEGVNRTCTKKFNGLLDLQKQMCGDTSIQVHDVSIYTSQIENILVCKKVFLVLDDVDSLQQLDALLRKKGFHPGSKIIITTKDKSLVDKFAPIVQPNHKEIITLEGLHNDASLQLLSYHAFKESSPREGYEEVSQKLIEYCQGHPLALKVLGESLCTRDVAEWEECMEGLKEEPNSHVQKVLQMSFDSMSSNNDKELFKHIACFFVGEDRKFIETMLKACGIRRVVHGIKNLIDKCLLTIGPENELQMHQLLQEMGRDIVRQESPNKPWKRSRLWCHEESFDVLEKNKGTGKLIGLVLDVRMLEKEKSCGSVELKTDALRWLCMHGFPLKSIRLDSPMENLASLDMSYSNLESFDLSYSNPEQPGKRQKLTGSCSQGKWLLRSLKILKITFCKELRSVGGFSQLPALERLIITDCESMIAVCESIEQCDELVFMELRNCIMLRMPPRTMVKLGKVEEVILNGCNLGQASSSSIMEATMRVSRPSLIAFPRSLVSLSLISCSLSNESFPLDLSFLPNLKDLNLSRNPIDSLPDYVRSLPNIENLTLEYCEMLKTVHSPPTL